MCFLLLKSESTAHLIFTELLWENQESSSSGTFFFSNTEGFSPLSPRQVDPGSWGTEDHYNVDTIAWCHIFIGFSGSSFPTVQSGGVGHGHLFSVATRGHNETDADGHIPITTWESRVGSSWMYSCGQAGNFVFLCPVKTWNLPFIKDIVVSSIFHSVSSVIQPFIQIKLLLSHSHHNYWLGPLVVLWTRSLPVSLRNCPPDHLFVLHWNLWCFRRLIPQKLLAIQGLFVLSAFNTNLLVNPHQICLSCPLSSVHMAINYHFLLP